MSKENRFFRLNQEPNYYSFLILGVLWGLSFIAWFLYAIMGKTERIFEDMSGLEYVMGAGALLGLIVAAWEDLRYGCAHVTGVVILTVIMHYILPLLGVLGFWGLLAVIAAVILGGAALFSTGGLGLFFLVEFLAAGGSLATIALWLLALGAVISTIISLGGAW